MTHLPISLTDQAAKKISSLSNAAPNPLSLRIEIEGGGCSGFQYIIKMVENGREDDLIIEHNGANALIDALSVPLLTGSVIDYVDELIGAQFKILNPNASTSCGCGVSFSI